jgi:hypothetical protein
MTLPNISGKQDREAGARMPHRGAHQNLDVNHDQPEWRAGAWRSRAMPLSQPGELKTAIATVMQKNSSARPCVQ